MEQDALGCTRSRQKSVETMSPKAERLGLQSEMRCFMTRRPLLLVYLSAIGGVLLPLIAGQSVPISIDCGSTSSYTDKIGLYWTTDNAYITAGSNRNVTVRKDQDTHAQQMSTARYFHEGRSKNCYVLPVVYNASYLIRAGFLFSDLVSNELEGYSFSLSIDSTIVDTVYLPKVDDLDNQMLLEYQTASRSTSNQLVFCIIRGVGSPFISSLELRQLSNQMHYSVVLFNLKYMKKLFRANYGVEAASPVIRWPDDKFDRLWPGTHIDGSLTAINSTRNVETDIWDLPPEKVMQSALTVERNHSFLPNLGSFVTPTVASVYVAFYFAQIRDTYSIAMGVDIYLNNRFSYNFTLHSIYEYVYSYATAHDPFGSPFQWAIRSDGTSDVPLPINGAEMYAIYDTDSTTTAPLDVLALNGVQQQIPNLKAWTGDPCLPISWDWVQCNNNTVPTIVTTLIVSGYQLSGTIPESIASLSSLTDLRLDNNSFTGSIPDLSRLINLRTLHLQNNRLTGTIPASLADIPNLSELFLEGNTLTGPVPSALLNKAGLNYSVGVLLSAPGPINSESKKKGSIIGSVVGAVATIPIVIAVFLLVLRRRLKKNDKQPNSVIPNDLENTPGSAASDKAPVNSSNFPQEDLRGEDLDGSGSQHSQRRRVFSLAQVLDATNNYERKIGEGGFGSVYYGKLPTGEEVAVKVKSATSSQGQVQFSNEVRLLSTVHHIHLVSLVGFCEEDNQQILIYEYMHHGTLEDHICNPDLAQRFDWRTRLGVALSAARGLEYLHVYCRPSIIHRDVKSSNILMNERFEAKVGDFGIYKETHNQTGVSTNVQGTYGYLDPEYFNTQKVTYKSDVYAFGVILLEIISGLPAIDRSPMKASTLNRNLAFYAKQILKDGDLDKIVDASLRGRYDKDAMWKVAELALECVQLQGIGRPDMTQVVSDLVEAVKMEHTGTPKLTMASPGPFDVGTMAFLDNAALRSDSGIGRVQYSWTQPRPR